MKNKKFAVWLLALLLFACQTPEMLVDNNLKENTTCHEVEGRNGWLINQKINFGEYRTGKVNRGWTKGYNYPFIVRFSGAKEKLSFSVFDQKNNKAEVFCLGKLKEQDLTLFKQYFEINIKTEDAFTGSVVLNDSAAIDFYVANLNQNNHFKNAEGWILGENMEFKIQSVKNLSSGQKSWNTQVPGFEFVLNGKTVGAVETLNKGKVWLNNSLANEQKLALAAVAAALLLRSELAEHNDETI